MDFLPDNFLTNEYAFTFFITFLSVTIKGIANKTEGFKSILKGETYDFGPELIFISISFAVSKLTELYSQTVPSPFAIVLKTIIFHLLILVFLIVFMRRMAYKENQTIDPIRGMYVPLFIGFASLYVVLTYTLSING